MHKTIEDKITEQRAIIEAKKTNTELQVFTNKLVNMYGEFTTALTLTTDLYKLGKTVARTREEIDETMKREVQHLQNKINTLLYGNNWFKKWNKGTGKRLKLVVFREWNKGGKQAHLHIAIKAKNKAAGKLIAKEMADIWKRTRFGGVQHYIDDVRDDGFTGYCAKDIKAQWNGHYNDEGLYLEQTHL